MTIRDDYTRWAERYDTDTNRTRDLDRRVTERILGGRRFSRTVEAGCGTGKNTLFLAGISDAVLALDFSPGMLSQARRNISAANVRFVEADLAERWPVPSGGTDLVSCNLVLEHFRELRPFFLEAARALRPGGLLFGCELHPFRQYGGTQARFEDALGTPSLIEAFTHHVSDFTSAAHDAGFALERLEEWWHDEDAGKPPRLISLLFRRQEKPE
jgi:malonyl-CoA O-methyltransferase